MHRSVSMPFPPPHEKVMCFVQSIKVGGTRYLPMLAGSFEREGANVDFCQLPTTRSRGARGMGDLDYSTTASTYFIVLPYLCNLVQYTFDLGAVPLPAVDKQASHSPISYPLFSASIVLVRGTYTSETLMPKIKQKVKSYMFVMS